MEFGQNSLWVVKKLKMFKNYNFILLSGSPRRAELLHSLGINFSIIKPNIIEQYPQGINPKEVPAYLSRQKSMSLQGKTDANSVKIAADTIVYANERILGKPKNKIEAREMLNIISNNTHQVITGVTITYKDKTITFTESTDVTFSKLTTEEIMYYIDNFSPYDKAGAYGIQEWVGLIGVRSISGCFYNVMGLPVSRVYEELRNLLYNQ